MDYTQSPGWMDSLPANNLVSILTESTRALKWSPMFFFYVKQFYAQIEDKRKTARKNVRKYISFVILVLKTISESI